MSCADELWVRTPPVRPLAASRPAQAASAFAPCVAEPALSEAEVAELVAQLEAALEGELREAEAALVADYERSLAEEAVALGAAAAEAAEWAAGAETPVRCPVCCRRRLLQLRGVVTCACGGLRLDLSREGLGLAHVAAALAAAWEAHAARPCAALPAFAQGAPFGGPPSLWLSCGACEALEVVL